MPYLKNLLCQVEWNSPKHTPFEEYHTTYGDGHVQCYIAIPPSPTTFAIHLKSNGYIAPGLAMFVFVDGEYHCNRNRSNLLVPAPGVDQRDCEVDFRVRQKEHNIEDGVWRGKEWHFGKVTEGTPTKLPLKEQSPVNNDQHAARVGEHSGLIEVVVLRCFHPQFSKTHVLSPSSVRSSMSSARHSFVDDQEVPLLAGAMFDGANDSPPPIRRGRHHKSIGAEKPSKASFTLFKDGMGPPSNLGVDSLQQRETRSSKDILSSYRLGFDENELGGKRDLPYQSQPITTNQPVRVGLRGGGGLEPHLSNDVDHQSSVQSTARGSRRRHGSPAGNSPQNSTGTYTPDPNWANIGTAQTDEQWKSKNTWTWEPKGNAEGNHHLFPPGYGPNQAEWETSATNQSGHAWNSTKVAHGRDHQSMDWSKTNDQEGHYAGGENHQMGQVENWNAGNDQSNGWLPSFTPVNRPGDLPRVSPPQNMQDMVFGLSANPALSVSLDSSKGATSKPPSVISAAPKGPLPGSWSPRLGAGHQNAMADSTKRRAADLNAERAKAAKAELDAKLSNGDQSHFQPTSPFSVGNLHSIPKPTTPTPGNIKSGNPHFHPQHTTAREQPIAAETNTAEVPIREVRSPSPMEYTHKMSVPRYMDTISDPYARFIFQYREDTIVSDMCDIDIVEPKEHLYDRLSSLTKAEIINLLIQEREDAAKEDEEDKETMKSSLRSAGYQPNLQAANQKLDQWEQNNNNGKSENPNNNNGGPAGRGSGSTRSTGERNSGSGGNSNLETNQGNGAAGQGNGDWDNVNNDSVEQLQWDDGNQQDQSNNDGSWNDNSGGNVSGGGGDGGGDADPKSMQW